MRVDEADLNRVAAEAVPADLRANLERQTPGQGMAWAFFRVRPEVALYVPVLQFAPDETVFPTGTGIWATLGPAANGKTQEAYEKVYAALGDKRWQGCKIYHRERSYAGSWLVEYWMYYPFDAGYPNQHMHDSERIFVEVDKLGGAVRNVLASSHGQFAPNNNYVTRVRGARPVTLPLYALVERNKHAMSPDLDRDAKFTRGVDENLYKDGYAVWGIRDIGSFSESFMKPYNPAMTLPRRKEDRLALAEQPNYFPSLEVSPDRDVCSLLPFPENAHAEDLTVGTAEAAATHMNTQADAQKPENIYKPWVLPHRQVRFGIAPFDRDGLSRQLYFAYVADLRNLTGDALRLPGRLAFEYMWAPVKHRDFFTEGTQTFTLRLSHEMYAGVRYERLLTNTQGFYGGITPHFRRARLESVNGTPLTAPTEWDYDGVWYRLGYIIELPFRTQGNMAHHVGIVFSSRGAARFEWRMSFGFLRHRGRTSFGLRPNDPNPYE